MLGLAFGLALNPSQRLAAQSTSFAVLPPDRSVTLARRDGGSFQLKEDSNFYYLRIDTAFMRGGDSVVYFPPTIEPSTVPGCSFRTDAPGYLGDSMHVQPDGRHVFFNSVGDSIFFYPGFTAADSWPFFRYTDGTGNWIEATPFTLATTALIPGYRDSIKVVQLIGRTPGGAPRPSDPYHATFMGLTEFNGFFRGFRLADVPDTPTTLYHQWRGITGPDTGNAHLNRRRVFDLQPGNERHYRRYAREGSPADFTETEEFYRYLTADRRFSPAGDTLILETYRAMLRTVLHSATGITDTVRILDTIDLRIPLRDYAFLNAFPREAFQSTLDGSLKAGYSIQYYDTFFFNRSFKQVFNHFSLNEGVPCLEPDASPLTEWTFLHGLGLFHYASAPEDDPGFAREEIDMVYYQKDLDVWGIPFDFDELLSTGVPALPLSLEGLKLYPNPSAGQFWIDGSKTPECRRAASGEGMHLRLHDPMGRLVMERIVQNATGRMDAAHLPSGLYHLECRCGQGVQRMPVLLQH